MQKTEIIKPSFIKFLQKNYSFIILLVLGFFVVTIIAYYNIYTSKTVSSYSMEEFEIGQIADRTIYADRSLPADAENPVVIQKGEKIIKKGFPISEESFYKLKKMAESPEYIDYRAFADSLFYLLLLTVFWILLFSPGFLGRKVEFKEVVLHVVCFIFIYIAAVFTSRIQVFSSPFTINILIPVIFCSLIIAVLFDQLSALFMVIIFSLGILNATGFEIVPSLFALASGVTAVRIVKNMERRIDMVIVSLILSLFNIVFFVAMKVIFNESLENIPLYLFGIAFNGFISGILALGFITPLEMILNTASVFRLMDLSDLNNPTMQKMLLTASGTYNHSLMVASLAENACKKIGANALLARIGAYYHDIGKMDQSQYFVENQTGENKHNDINPSLSVSVIRSHVKRGLEKAIQLHLPVQVLNIIKEHHGNSVISYFYNEAKEKDPNVNPEDFSYTGEPPSTKESAVVMLADTVEAACRTLEKPSVPRLEKFITQLINGKKEHGQLDNCDLTFRDLNAIKESFVQILAGYYHSRIEYPDQKDPDDVINKSELGEKTLSEAKRYE